MLNPLENWRPKEPASETMIERLISDNPWQLPKAYLDLMRMSNGGYAELSASPWTVDFWSVEDIIRLNHEYGVYQGAPNFLAFGSNLGEELLAFDRRAGSHSGVYMLPWHAPNEADVLIVTDSFEKLIETIRNTDDI